MPNHCQNDLYYDGPAEEVEKFKTLVGLNDETPRFNFDALIPYPDNFKQMDEEAQAFSFFGKPDKQRTEESITAAREAYVAKWGTDKDGYNSGGYNWCCTNWGTKWNAYEVQPYEHPLRGACVTFETAWSPPLPAIRALIEKFPLINFELEYYERGGEFCGGLVHYADYPDCDGEWSGDYGGTRGG